MTAEYISELNPARTHERWRRAWLVAGLGPVTVLAGVVWALAQPSRITLLHPHGQGFWWLLVEPPLLVFLVGLLFHLVVMPGLREDLRSEER